MKQGVYRIRRFNGIVSTDDIIPGKYKHMFRDPSDLAPHVFESHSPEFAGSIKTGDVIWSDSLFGIGSSREQAATSLLSAGIIAVIAPAFGRIFYRNAWNVGLRLFEAPVPKSGVDDGEVVTIDTGRGVIEGAFGSVRVSRPPDRLEKIISSGGLLEWIKTQNRQQPRGRNDT